MKKQARRMLILILAIVLSAASSGFAAIYKYVDENGIISFSDDLQAIPEQSRAAAEIVSGKQSEDSKKAVQKLPPAHVDAAPGADTTSFAREKESGKGLVKQFFSSRMLISVIVVVSGLFAFVILGVLDADHKKAVKIVRLVILWVMSVYLIVAHAGDIVHLFRTVEGKVDTVQRESEEKGKKAAKAMKELNALVRQVDDPDSQDSGSVEPEKRD